VLGKEPAQVMIGHIDPLTGQPKGGSWTATQSVGETAIPNYSTAWGIETKGADGKLTGEIEFLQWGDQKGGQIRLRYLPSCPSLSLNYQIEKKMDVEDEDTEIVVAIGLNKYSEVEDKWLVQMLKHHGLNKSNKSRNPRHNFVMFKDYDPAQELKFEANDIERRQEAERIVLDARDNEEALRVLAEIFEMDPEVPEKYLLKQLLAVTQNHVHFFKVMEAFTKQYGDVLAKAKEVGLIDFTPDGISVMMGGTKEPLLSGLDVEGYKGKKSEDKAAYLLDHITEPLVYHGLQRLVEVFNEYTNSLE
jgi:hypothetical protein